MTPSQKKRRQFNKELVCSKCDTSLDSTQIYCYQCGEPSDVLKEDLSAIKTIRNTWHDYKLNKGRNYAFAIFFAFLLLLPLGAIILYTRSSYLIHNLILLVWTPLLFIPFSQIASDSNAPLTIRSYIRSLNSYPKFFTFILLNIVYFYLLKIITDSVDPILNLVRFIMALYWLAIVVPLPSLMAHKNKNFLKSWLTVYKGGKETRWQQFFILLICSAINAIGLALLGVGLLITIPFTITVLETYYLKMDRYGLFDGIADKQIQ